jgi:hypothetical protein
MITEWKSFRELWPDQPEFDVEAFLRNSEQMLKDSRACLDAMRKFIDETPAVMRSDAPLDVKRRRRQQCMAYLYGDEYDEYADPPQGEVVPFDRSQK